MASFLPAYKNTLKHEGGYVPARVAASISDPGGETYKGIARNFNPSWPGWKLIDQYNASFGTAKHNFIFPIPKLDLLHQEHIKEKFWDINSLDSINNQSLANYLFDIGYGSGPATAAKAIQNVLGIKADGKIGKTTISNINLANQKRLFEELQAYREDWLRKYVGGKSYIGVLLKRNSSFFFQEA